MTFPTGTPSAGARYDVFVSYAHADDVAPINAPRGWVTTLVEELNKILRRKLGGDGASVWMDHQLGMNKNVTAELLAAIGASRTLLLVLSPAYLESDWCERELANYLASAEGTGRADSVFAVETDQMDRASWHPALQSITPLRFWERPFDAKGTRLAGYPVPKADPDSLYWTNVADLAHAIADRIKTVRAECPVPKRSVVLAETTDDLRKERDAVAASLRQRQDIVLLPARPYRRDSHDDYLAAVRHDLGRSSLFVQLLSQHPGYPAPGSERTFVSIQALAAREAEQRRALPVMQWRHPDPADLESIDDEGYRRLLAGATTGTLDSFRTDVLKRLDALDVPAKRARQTDLREGEGSLSIFLQVDHQIDGALADQLAEHLIAAGVVPILAQEPAEGETYLDVFKAQEGVLRRSDGFMLVYGRTKLAWVSSVFSIAQRVFGLSRTDKWSALLDWPPDNRPRPSPRIPGRNVMTIECRQGFDPALLQPFLAGLRPRGGGHA